jgi:hypothetical protein
MNNTEEVHIIILIDWAYFARRRCLVPSSMSPCCVLFSFPEVWRRHSSCHIFLLELRRQLSGQ